MLAMLGGDGGGTPGPPARTEPLGERREVCSDRGRSCWQQRYASEAAPGHLSTNGAVNVHPAERDARISAVIQMPATAVVAPGAPFAPL
jgi:hypothetical protein